MFVWSVVIIIGFVIVASTVLSFRIARRNFLRRRSVLTAQPIKMEIAVQMKGRDLLGRLSEYV
jgi:hypothetical protein